MDLAGQFSGRGQDQGAWIDSSAVAILAFIAWDLRRSSAEQVRDHWEQEGGSLSRSSLRTSHQITSAQYNRNRVPLHRSWSFIVCGIDVVDQTFSQVNFKEAVHKGLRAIFSTDFNRDFIIFIEINFLVA